MVAGKINGIKLKQIKTTKAGIRSNESNIVKIIQRPKIPPPPTKAKSLHKRHQKEPKPVRLLQEKVHRLRATRIIFPRP